MTTPEYLKPNRTQALGLVFLVIAAFSATGGWAWVMAYWDYSPVCEYRGFDVYYFPNINVYGIDTGGEPQSWRFNSGLQGAKNMIDSWLDAPLFIETYRDWAIYKLAGIGLYYGEYQGTVTLNHVNVTDLETYIDDLYYPTLVYTIHRDGGDYLIYRQGIDSIQYWVEYEGDILEYFETDDAARAYVYEIVEEAEETQENPEDPAEASDQPADTEGEETLGDLLDAQKWVISAISGAMGLGLVILGSTRRED